MTDRSPSADSAARSDAEVIAEAFHHHYEALAPSFDYETRPDSAVAWENVPEPNRKLMVAVVELLIKIGAIQPGYWFGSGAHSDGSRAQSEVTHPDTPAG